MYQITFYVPEGHTDTVKEAMFKSGAGKIGHYDHCAWQTQGVGQFQPLDESNPYQGKKGQIETIPEIKLEMVCTDDCIRQVLQALIEAHPYETPAYAAWKIKTIEDLDD